MKVFKKSILYGMVAVMLLLGLSVGGFAREYVDVPAAEMYPAKQMIFDWLDQPEIINKYGKMSDVIWSYAELGMQEFTSSKLLADHLEENGFKVERGMAGMPTCFVASYGSGKPVLAMMCEYDALPMISQKGRVATKDPYVSDGDAVAPGHGCGHNAQGPAAVSAAIALKMAMDKYGLKGTIRVLGCPAEETLVSRPYMVRAGLFDDVDACLKNHTGGGLGGGQMGGIKSNAMFSVEFSFKGVTSHAASPWGAKSALDAVDIMNVATNFLREHLYYTYRMHYVIPSAGEAPNVVPDYAKVWYFVRNTDERLLGMYQKVVNCAEAAAHATGTTLTIRVLSAIHQKHENGELAKIFHQNCMIFGMPEWTEEEQEFSKAIQVARGSKPTGLRTELSRLYKYDPDRPFTGGGSADSADVSWVTALAGTSIPKAAAGGGVGAGTGGGQSGEGHHWASVAGTYGSIVWKGINANAKGMAGTFIDLITKPELLKAVRNEFEAMAEKYPYESYLPDDAMPPNDLNRELMSKWRPALEESHIEWEY